MRLLRLKHSISLVDLAAAAKVSPQRISQIELSPEPATTYHRTLIAEAFAIIAYKKGRGGADLRYDLRRLEEDEAPRVKEVLGLSDEETLQVIRNRRGEGLICAGHNRISLAFQPTQEEYDMITTNRADLEAQMQKKTPPDSCSRVAHIVVFSVMRLYARA